jgi:hypothetical protein
VCAAGQRRRSAHPSSEVPLVLQAPPCMGAVVALRLPHILHVSASRRLARRQRCLRNPCRINETGGSLVKHRGRCTETGGVFDSTPYREVLIYVADATHETCFCSGTAVKVQSRA